MKAFNSACKTFCHLFESSPLIYAVDFWYSIMLNGWINFSDDSVPLLCGGIVLNTVTAMKPLAGAEALQECR